MNKIYFIFSFLIYFIYINGGVVNGTVFYHDLTDSKSLNQYPSNTSSNKCSFLFKLIVINTDKNFQIKDLTHFGINQEDYNIKPFLNETSLTRTIFQISITKGYGSYSENFIASTDNNSEIVDPFTYTFTCNEVDISLLSYTTTNLVSNDPFYGIGAILTITGANINSLNKLILFNNIGITIESIKRNDNSYFIIITSPAITNSGADYNFAIVFQNVHLAISITNKVLSSDDITIFSTNHYPEFSGPTTIYKPYGLFTTGSIKFTYLPSFSIQTGYGQQYPYFFLWIDQKQYKGKLLQISGSLKSGIIYLASLNTLKDISSFNDININDDKIYDYQLLLQKNNDYQAMEIGNYTFNYKKLNSSISDPLSTVSGDKIEIISTILNLSHGQVSISNKYFKESFDFPYGYSDGNSKSFKFSVSIIEPTNSLIGISFETEKMEFIQNPLKLLSTNPNIIFVRSFEMKLLYNRMILIKISVVSKYNIKSISIGSDLGSNVHRYDKCVQGDTNNGTFELLFNFMHYPTDTLNLDYLMVNVFDVIGNIVTFRNGDYYYDYSGKLQVIPSPTTLFTEFTLQDISNVTFALNDIDTTNRTLLNTVFVELIKTPNILPKGDCLVMEFQFNNGKLYDNVQNYKPSSSDTIYLQWDDTLYGWIGGFRMPANLMTGQIYYYILSASQIYNTISNFCPLNVKSDNADLMGPIFSSFIKRANGLFNDYILTGWDITISDEINGFKNGYIVVRGDLDNSIYNYTLTSELALPGSTIYNCSFSIVLNISNTPCTSQSYTITNVKLIDTQNHVTQFNQIETNSQKYPQLDPFILFLETESKNINLTSVIVDCINSFSVPPDYPKILSVTEIGVAFNYTSNGIFADYEFTVSSQFGLKKDQMPTCYLTSFDSQSLSVKAFIIDQPTNYRFKCLIPFENAFGFPIGYYFSIYGLIDNSGNFSGSSGGTLNLIKGSSSSYIPLGMVILKSVTYLNGWLWIEGYSLDNSVNVLFNSTYNQPVQTDSLVGKTILKVRANLSPGIYKIKVETISPSLSNEVELIVESTLYPPIIQTPSPTIITTTPKQTSSQKCFGSPLLCGGGSNGYCKTDVGCICYPPFIGIDCTSQIIVIPQPDLTSKDPSISINITTPNEENEEGGSKINLSSIISIVELREINTIENKIVNRFKFDKWLQTSLSSTVSQYLTNVTDNNNTFEIIGSVNATLEWFNVKTNITFANQLLIMNPSTLKYTIELKDYKFQSTLNTLQIVMFAQIQSSQSDICSSTQFGNTVTDDESTTNNDNFIKLQVGKHSFFGKYIKRAIVDEFKIVTIENELINNVDDTSNTGGTGGSGNNANSYIGINVPYFSKSILLDPNFSVLLDNQEASSDSVNSICNNNKSSKLSNGAIAGIAIGGFAILVIISLIVVKLIYRSRGFLSLKIKVYKLLNKKI